MRCTLRPKSPWPAEAKVSCRGTEGAAGCGALIPSGMNASFALAV
jgi:hypothetical protein